MKTSNKQTFLILSLVAGFFGLTRPAMGDLVCPAGDTWDTWCPGFTTVDNRGNLPPMTMAACKAAGNLICGPIVGYDAKNNALVEVFNTNSNQYMSSADAKLFTAGVNTALGGSGVTETDVTYIGPYYTPTQTMVTPAQSQTSYNDGLLQQFIQRYRNAATMFMQQGMSSAVANAIVTSMTTGTLGVETMNNPDYATTYEYDPCLIGATPNQGEDCTTYLQNWENMTPAQQWNATHPAGQGQNGSAVH